MKYFRVLLFSLFLLCAAGLEAQQNHFIYIQTENKQPFYLKFDKKLISSSVSGYLIIPKLTDGQYVFTVGFPKNEWVEQVFTCTIDKKDLGFLLKNFGEKGWGFFNLQTLDVTMAAGKAGNKDQPADAKADEFSTMLANVVNDPSIKQVEPPVEKPEGKPVTEEPKPLLTEETAEVNAEVKPPASVIKKGIARISDAGQEIVYIDINGDKQDTINVFIPVDKPAAEKKDGISKVNEVVEDKKVAGEPVKIAEENKEVMIPTIQPDTVNAGQVKAAENKKDTKFLDIEITPPVTEKENTAAENKPGDKPGPVENKPAMINSDCRNFATDEDFLKLRKKMVSTEDEDKMIETAKKVFRSRCFTTEQIKNLGVLFLKDSGKYNFYDAAYPFVSDSHNYGTLAGQLADPYYINRFNVMIRH